MSKEFRVRDQVVVKQPLRNRSDKVVRVGNILSFSQDGTTANVSLPKAGGGSDKVSVPVASLEPVSEKYKRASVHPNPAFRQIQ